MQQHSFDDSDLQVTRLGLGLAAIGRPAYITLQHDAHIGADKSVGALQAQAHRVLDAAYSAGIRYFDAARSYGRAEAFLRSWLDQREIQPDDVVIGSKWGYTYTANWQIDADTHEVKEHSLDVLKRQWNETQSHLGDYLALYQIHSATLKTGVLDNADVLTHLAKLKRDGFRIGVTVSGPDQRKTIEKAITKVIDGVRLFDSVQATWNVLEQSATKALIGTHLTGIEVIVKEALANGRLTASNNNPTLARKMQTLQQQADRLNTTIDALAIAAVIAQDWCGIVLSGAATPAHVQSNVKALDVAWDDEAQQALTDLVEPPQDYWRIRSQLAWN